MALKSWHGKSRGGTTGHRIFLFALKHMGTGAAYFLLRFVAVYFLFFAPNAFLSTFRYFNKVLGYGFWKSLKSVYKNFYIFGVTLLDKTAAAAGLKTDFTFDFDGEEYLRQMVTNNTGGILISAHIGNWEIASQLLARLGVKVNIVMLDVEYANLKKYLSQITTKKTFEVIPIGKDLTHIYAITQALRAKELVCIHADRYLDGSKAVKAAFMGKEAFFPAGPFQMAAATHAPVSFVFAMKEAANHYHFYATPARIYSYKDAKSRDAELKACVCEYARALETMVRKYPLQWFNYYDFWKTDAPRSA